MARDREIKVSLLGDAKSLERAFDRASKSGSSFGKNLSGKVASGLGTVVKGAGLAGAAVVGLGIAVGTVLVRDMAKQQAASVQTNTVIASTGRVAGVTRKHVEELATAIQNKSGADDQAIQTGENMLLTFTNIRNEAGKGNKIFDQTTNILADMTVAMGSDPQKQAIQLGKALNDPVKGITALQKVGVTFSAEQKKTIASMVETGNVVGAQKVILAELNKEFGGSAKAAGEALPGQLGILKGRLMDLGSSVLSGAMPALQKLTKGAIDLVAAIQRNMPAIKAAWAQYGAPVFAAIVTAGEKVITWTRANWPQIKATIKAVIDWIGTNIVPTVRSVVNNMIALWQKFGGKIMAVVKPTLEGLRALIQGVLALIRGDWGAAWENLKTLVSKGFQAIKATFSLNFAVFKSLGKKLGGAILNGLEALPGMLADVGTRALSALTDKLLSFHVSIKTKSYLGVPFPVGMSVGFDGGGGSTSGPTITLPSVNLTGASPDGGLGSSKKPGKSFLNGNLDKVTGGSTGSTKIRTSPTYTPHDSSGTGGGGGGGGGAGDKASAAADKAKAKLQSLADAAAKTRDIVVGKMQEAFSKVSDFALKAFDGATSTGLTKLQENAAKAARKIQDDLDVTLQKIGDTQRVLTPAEQALKDLQGAHDQDARNADINSAINALAAAQALGDPAEIAAAQKAVDDAAYNQRIFDLGAQATAERAIADQKAIDDAKVATDKAAADQKVVEDQLAKDQLNYSAARELKRIALDDQLGDFKASLEKHPKEWKKINAKVMALFDDDFGPKFKTAGENNGDAYVDGLKAAFDKVGITIGPAGVAIKKADDTGKRANGASSAVMSRSNVAPISAGAGPIGGGVTVHVDARNTGMDANALERQLSWAVRTAWAS